MTPDQPDGAAFAKPSATIVIARSSARGPELFMVKRRAGDAFGDSYAFPGGVVDAHDNCASLPGSGVSAAEADAMLGTDNGALAYFCAGIRELFEETGVLLAKRSSGAWAECGTEIEALRIQVDNGALPWSDFLQQQQLHMAFDALHYFAHWETPLSMPKRWTTRFFVAELPAGQSACHDGTETTDSRWLQASDALQLGLSGDIRLPYPTIKTLEALRELDSIDAIFNWTEAQRQGGIQMTRLEAALS